MFVQYLSERQQAILLHYAQEILRADGIVEAVERAHLEILLAQVKPGVEPEDLSMEDVAGAFDVREGRIAFLLELIGTAHADKDYSPGEFALVMQLAEALGLGADDVARAESWVKRQLLLVDEALEHMKG